MWRGRGADLASRMFGHRGCRGQFVRLNRKNQLEIHKNIWTRVHCQRAKGKEDLCNIHGNPNQIFDRNS